MNDDKIAESSGAVTSKIKDVEFEKSTEIPRKRYVCNKLFMNSD